MREYNTICTRKYQTKPICHNNHMVFKDVYIRMLGRNVKYNETVGIK